MIAWVRRVAPWRWKPYRKGFVSLSWVLSPLVWLALVLAFGLPWWVIALPLPVPFIEWQTWGFHFTGLGLRLYWMMFSEEWGLKDNN